MTPRAPASAKLSSTSKADGVCFVTPNAAPRARAACLRSANASRTRPYSSRVLSSRVEGRSTASRAPAHPRARSYWSGSRRSRRRIVSSARSAPTRPIQSVLPPVTPGTLGGRPAYATQQRGSVTMHARIVSGPTTSSMFSSSAPSRRATSSTMAPCAGVGCTMLTTSLAAASACSSNAIGETTLIDDCDIAAPLERGMLGGNLDLTAFARSPDGERRRRRGGRVWMAARGLNRRFRSGPG